MARPHAASNPSPPPRPIPTSRSQTTPKSHPQSNCSPEEPGTLTWAASCTTPPHVPHEAPQLSCRASPCCVPRSCGQGPLAPHLPTPAPEAKTQGFVLKPALPEPGQSSPVLFPRPMHCPLPGPLDAGLAPRSCVSSPPWPPPAAGGKALPPSLPSPRCPPPRATLVTPAFFLSSLSVLLQATLGCRQAHRVWETPLTPKVSTWTRALQPQQHAPAAPSGH